MGIEKDFARFECGRRAQDRNATCDMPDDEGSDSYNIATVFSSSHGAKTSSLSGTHDPMSLLCSRPVRRLCSFLQDSTVQIWIGKLTSTRNV